MTRQRALRGHGPPPPLRGARARVPPPREHGLPRPRRAARAARRPAGRARGPGLARFRRGDHLGDPARAAGDAIRALVASTPARGARRAGARAHPPADARALLQPRVLLLLLRPPTSALERRRRRGHQHAVARAPRLRARGASGDGRVLGGGMDKALHVSPFMGMDQRYVWHAAEPGRARCRCTSRAARAASARSTPRSTSRACRSPAARSARSIARYPAATLRVSRADLRPRARAQAQGRPRPPAPSPEAA